MILLVEDDDSVRGAMSDLLVSEGYEIVEAKNGKEALDLLELMIEKEIPCIILLDLMMPVMDGKTFLNELNKNALLRSKKIPIVVTSAMINAAAENLPFVSKYLDKPYNLSDVLETLEQYCA